MAEAKKISEDLLQHKKDAEKALIDLDTVKSNISYGAHVWNDVVEIRKKHINDFIISLEKQEQDFEHFK